MSSTSAEEVRKRRPNVNWDDIRQRILDKINDPTRPSYLNICCVTFKYDEYIDERILPLVKELRFLGYKVSCEWETNKDVMKYWRDGIMSINW